MDPTLLRLNILVGETHSHKGKARAKAAKDLCDFLSPSSSSASSTSTSSSSSTTLSSSVVAGKINNPHISSYLHILQELALLTDYQPRSSVDNSSSSSSNDDDNDEYIDIETDTRRTVVRFLLSLANDASYVSRIIPTLATLSSDKDIEVTTASFTGLALALRPAFLNILHSPGDPNHIKAWTILDEVIRRIPQILQANELPKEIHRVVLHFAEQYVYVFTPVHIPPPSVLHGIDITMATSVTIDAIPSIGHLILRKDMLMQEATRAVNAILASLVRNSPGTYPKRSNTKENDAMELTPTENDNDEDDKDMDIDTERLEAEIITCQRIGILRVGFAMMIMQGLFSLARKPPQYAAGVTDNNQFIVLLPSYQKAVKQALNLIRNGGGSPDMVNQIDAFLRGPEVNQIAIKPYKPTPPPLLDLNIVAKLPPGDIIEFLMINLINFEGTSKKIKKKKTKKTVTTATTTGENMEEAEEEDNLLFKFLDTVATEELSVQNSLATVLPDTSSFGSSNSSAAPLASNGSSATTSTTVAPDGKGTKVSNIYNVPAVKNWYSTSSLPWQNNNPLDEGNYALHRIIMDTFIPQYMTDSAKLPTNMSTSNASTTAASSTTYANILRNIIGSQWINTIDRLLTVLQMMTSSSPSSTIENSTTNTVAMDTRTTENTDSTVSSSAVILSYIPLCEALLEQMFPSTPTPSHTFTLHTLDIGQVRRLATTLVLACTRIYQHDGPNDQYIKLTYLSLNALLGAIQRMERYDTADLLLQFIMDIPSLPAGIINVLANLCVKGLILQLPDDIQEYMEKSAMACLIYTLLLRPKLRNIIVDTILALTVLDQVGEIAHKSALGNVTKRLLYVTTTTSSTLPSSSSPSATAMDTDNATVTLNNAAIREHTLLFIRSCLHSCLISCRTRTQQLIENGELDLSRSSKRRKQDPSSTTNTTSDNSSNTTTEELSETLYTGSSTPIDICIQVDSMFAGVHVNTLTLTTLRQIIKLALGGAMNSPVLLVDIFHLYKEIYNENSNDPALDVIIEEIRNTISNVHKVSKKSYGYLLLSFVCGSSSGSSGETIQRALSNATPSNVVNFSIQSSEVQFLLALMEILANTAVTEIMEDIQRKEDAMLQTTSTTPQVSVPVSSSSAITTVSPKIPSTVVPGTPTVLDSNLFRSHAVIQELILAIKCISLGPDSEQEHFTNGSADINGLRTPLLLVPVITLLPQDEVRSIIRQCLGNGNTVTIRMLMHRILRTPKIHAALTKEEIIATLIIEANRINERHETCTPTDKVRLLTEVSNVIYEEKEMFTDMIILAGLRKVIDLSIQLHISQPLLAPVTPILLMRCMLMMVQNFPETRSSIIELLLLYLRKVGVYVFESLDILKDWSNPNPSASSSSGPNSSTVPPPTCHVWEGFIILVKATIPLSLTLLVELPAPLLKLILQAKTQLPLAQRFRNWFSTWTGRNNAPKHVLEYINLIPTGTTSTSASATTKPTGSATSSSNTGTAASTTTTGLPALPSLGGLGKRER